MGEIEGTADDTVICGQCGHATSVAMIFVHLANEHGIFIDPVEIAKAPIIDMTEEQGE